MDNTTPCSNIAYPNTIQATTQNHGSRAQRWRWNQPENVQMTEKFFTEVQSQEKTPEIYKHAYNKSKASPGHNLEYKN